MTMFGRLLWVELYKLLRSRRLYVAILLVLATTAIITMQHKAAFERDQATSQEFGEKARQEYEQTVRQYENTIQRLQAKPVLTSPEQMELEETRHRLAQLKQQGPPVFQSSVNPAQAVYVVFLSDFGVHFVLPVITTLVVGADLAAEWNNRTLKLLLTQPVRRSDIYMGKWVKAVVFVFTFLLLETALGMVIGSVVFGGTGWFDPASAIPGVMAMTTEMNALEFVLGGTVYNALGMILTATIALTLSVYIASPIVILAATMFASLFGMVASDFLQDYATLTLIWPFGHLNFTKHFYADPLFTLPESIAVLVAYIVSLLVLGLRVFGKKDLYV